VDIALDEVQEDIKLIETLKDQRLFHQAENIYYIIITFFLEQFKIVSPTFQILCFLLCTDSRFLQFLFVLSLAITVFMCVCVLGSSSLCLRMQYCKRSLVR